ncbi:MAG: hypothetical protein JWR32_3668 [Mycobacterium sp.]|nr:hypothetical protein [Mycobacterium sp.]
MGSVTVRPDTNGNPALAYNKFTTQVVAPAASQKAVKTNATVLRAAITELYRTPAVVLAFVKHEKPDPAVTSSSVRATLKDVNNAWLISAFDPV